MKTVIVATHYIRVQQVHVLELQGWVVEYRLTTTHSTTLSRGTERVKLIVG